MKLSKKARKMLKEYRESFAEFDRIGGHDPASWDEITKRYQKASGDLHSYVYRLELEYYQTREEEK